MTSIVAKGSEKSSSFPSVSVGVCLGLSVGAQRLKTAGASRRQRPVLRTGNCRRFALATDGASRRKRT